MPEVEYDVFPLRIFLILTAVLFLAGSVGAQEELFHPVDKMISDGAIEEARAALVRIAQEQTGTPAELEAWLIDLGLERDGEAYLSRLKEMTGLYGDGRIPFALGQYRFAVGAYQAAAGDFRTAADALSGEEKEKALCLRGAALLGAGLTDEGISQLKEVAGRKPDRPVRARARFLAAQAEWKRGRAGKAASLLEALLEGENDFSLPALALFAHALQASGRERESGKRFEELLERYPESSEAEEARRALFLRGEAETESGYFVQIASFGEVENARRYLEARRAEGVGAVDLFEEVRGDARLHQVRIGPFHSLEEALLAKENLSRQGLNGLVVHADAGE